MKWVKCKDEDRSAVEILTVNEEELRLEYEILPAKQRIDQDDNIDFMANRISLDYQFSDGILGEFNGEIGVCCGIAMFSAIGLPLCSCSGSIDKVKHFVDRDVHNLRSGKDNLFVNKLTRNNGK